jgi:uncharacterized protein (DUF58 family)
MEVTASANRSGARFRVAARLAPHRDPRMTAYAVLALGLVALGLLTGRSEPIAAAAAIGAVFAVGLRRVEPVTIDTTIEVSARRVLTDDPITVDIELGHDRDLVTDVMLAGLSPALGDAEYRVTPHRGGTSAQVSFATTDWGIHELGHLVIRSYSPGAMCDWEQRVIDLGSVTVLPHPVQLSSMLSPRATQASAGGHPARVLGGDGSDFVDIREYQPGDRVRDINWNVTARRGMPHINRRRPERGGEVVIVLDATPDGWRQSDIGTALLQSAGEAVWGLARNHLAAQDRVGLLTQQADGVEWLPPEGGMRARYRVLETLLGANSTGGRPRTRRHSIQRQDLPPSALVIGVSALSNNLTLRSLAAMRAHGRTVGVLAIDAAQMLHETDELDAASLRLASMMFESHVAYVRRLGLPIVTWRPGEDLDRAVRRLADLTRRSIRTGAFT